MRFVGKTKINPKTKIGFGGIQSTPKNYTIFSVKVLDQVEDFVLDNLEHCEYIHTTKGQFASVIEKDGNDWIIIELDKGDGTLYMFGNCSKEYLSNWLSNYIHISSSIKNDPNFIISTTSTKYPISMKWYETHHMYLKRLVNSEPELLSEDEKQYMLNRAIGCIQSGSTEYYDLIKHSMYQVYGYLCLKKSILTFF